MFQQSVVQAGLCMCAGQVMDLPIFSMFKGRSVFALYVLASINAEMPLLYFRNFTVLNVEIVKGKESINLNQHLLAIHHFIREEPLEVRFVHLYIPPIFPRAHRKKLRRQHSITAGPSTSAVVSPMPFPPLVTVILLLCGGLSDSDLCIPFHEPNEPPCPDQISIVAGKCERIYLAYD